MPSTAVASCPVCRAEGPADDVHHAAWCPLFMRGEDHVDQLTLPDGLYYGFADKATYDAVQRDKAQSPWFQGRD